MSVENTGEASAAAAVVYKNKKYHHKLKILYLIELMHTVDRI